MPSGNAEVVEVRSAISRVIMYDDREQEFIDLVSPSISHLPVARSQSTVFV